MTTPQSSLPPQVSYSQVAKQLQIPTKEQAIVLDAIDGIPVQEYALAIADLVDPALIRYISRISHGRVCLYLANKETAEQLTEHYKKVKIGSNVLEIRPLISKAKRVIISNACPLISNEAILEQFAKYEITPCSSISYIRAGFNVTKIAHLLSFRRQVYLNPEDLDKMPPSFQIPIEGTLYHVYLSADKLTCFICKEEGHLAKFCKSQVINAQASHSVSATNSHTSNSASVLISENNKETYLVNSNVQAMPTDKDKNQSSLFISPAAKRALSTTSISTSNNESSVILDQSQSLTKEKTKKSAAKKAKKDVQDTTANDSVKLHLEPARELIENSTHNNDLNFDKITDFLVNTFGKQNIPEIAAEYTQDTNTLITLLEGIASKLTEKNLKSRVLRIKTRLTNAELSDSHSELSTTESVEMDV